MRKKKLYTYFKSNLVVLKQETLLDGRKDIERKIMLIKSGRKLNEQSGKFKRRL